MKVVLFCGGLGMRMREYSEHVPKPMVPVGNRPILWHLMRYYAHYGHKEFILCLGYRGEAIKSYFVDYKEWLSNDFVLSGSSDRIEMLASDIHDWRITFVETGLSANIGERLLAVRPHLEGEKTFLANYADGLTDAPLDAMVERFRQQRKTAALLATARSIRSTPWSSTPTTPWRACRRCTGPACGSMAASSFCGTTSSRCWSPATSW
jgi:glucose-1-phosphate cytidylyltransferase